MDAINYLKSTKPSLYCLFDRANGVLKKIRNLNMKSGSIHRKRIGVWHEDSRLGGGMGRMTYRRLGVDLGVRTCADHETGQKNGQSAQGSCVRFFHVGRTL